MPIGTAGISTISDAADDALATLENNPRSISLTNTEVFGTTDSPPTSPSKTISSFLDQRLTLARSQEDVHLEKIIVLDDAKNIYLDAIRTVDKPLIDSITQVNDGIQSVNDAYQARIDSGCTTDLFWRLIDAQQQVSGSTGGKAATTVVSYSFCYSLAYLIAGLFLFYACLINFSKSSSEIVHFDSSEKPLNGSA